jgi:hypothetical protein
MADSVPLLELTFNKKRLLIDPLIIVVSIAAWLVCSLLFCITVGLTVKQINDRAAPFMSARLKPFLTTELYALVFSLDLAGTVEQLTSEADRIRQELIDELRERGLPAY